MEHSSETRKGDRSFLRKITRAIVIHAIVLPIALYIHVRWFTSIGTQKDESIGTNLQNRRHRQTGFYLQYSTRAEFQLKTLTLKYTMFDKNQTIWLYRTWCAKRRLLGYW